MTARSYYDDDLARLFKPRSSEVEISAGTYIRRHRKHAVNAVNQWTREPKYRINELLEDFIERTDNLGLVVAKDHIESLSNLISYLTALVMNRRYTERSSNSR